jgi:hypothetical protein
VPVVVLAALTGFAITRGVLTPRAPVATDESEITVFVDPAPPVREPPNIAPAPSASGRSPDDVPGTPSPSASVIASPQGRPEPRPLRTWPRGPRRSSGPVEIRSAGSSAIPSRAPPNPYGL